MRQLVVVLGFVVGLTSACSPERPGDDGDDGMDLCTGDEDRCVGQTYQTCDDGVFVDAETCGGATSVCSSNLDGCVACDPAQGTIACSGDTAYNCNPDGSLGATIETCVAGEECMPGVGCTRACTADGVDLIYVVDEQYNLHSFDPRLIGTGTEFQLIGALNCDAAPTPVPGWLGEVTPFSMAVDRMARAWVLYTSGEIFHVDTQSAACSATPYVPQQGSMLLFGMAFRTDGPMADTEKLYLAGGQPNAPPMDSGDLAIVDPSTYSQTVVGPIVTGGENSAELTGTGAAELFGFWPGSTTGFVEQIDVATGAPIAPRYNVQGGFGGTIRAWAFAQWGGSFYLFVTVDPGLVANVIKLDKATGNATTVLMNTGRIVVGAGVSTCAPTQVE